MASGGSGTGRVRGLLLAWEVSAEQEEPWRRLLQELSEPTRKEGYARSRRRSRISAESVWLVPRASGGGVAVVRLEASDPERALRELGASEAPFESWYGGRMRELFGFDVARAARESSGELLFAWRDDVPGERRTPEGSGPDAPTSQKSGSVGIENTNRGDKH